MNKRLIELIIAGEQIDKQSDLELERILDDGGLDDNWHFAISHVIAWRREMERRQVAWMSPEHLTTMKSVNWYPYNSDDELIAIAEKIRVGNQC